MVAGEPFHARDDKVAGVVHLAFPGASGAVCGHYYYRRRPERYMTLDAVNCPWCLRMSECYESVKAGVGGE
jgi:hypothetical protein